MSCIKVRFAFSTNAYAQFPLVEALKRISICGYTGVEILADIPHAFPLEISQKEIFEISEVLAETGMSVSNVNANTAWGFHLSGHPCREVFSEPSLCSKSEVKRLARIEYTKRCIDLALTWGAPCVSVTSGRCLEGNPPLKAYKNLLNSLENILEYAEKKGINIGIEYEPGLLIENAEETAELLRDLPCLNLGVSLDVGHAKVNNEPLTKTITRFKKKIWNVHLEDIYKRKHYHLLPGKGDINFDKVYNILESVDYKNFVTFELHTYSDSPDEAAKHSLLYFQHVDKKKA